MRKYGPKQTLKSQVEVARNEMLSSAYMYWASTTKFGGGIPTSGAIVDTFNDKTRRWRTIYITLRNMYYEMGG